MDARTPSGVCVCVGRVGSEAANVCEWMGGGTQSTPCVCMWREACHVRVCEWQVWDGESEEREATRVDSVGGGCGGHGAHTATHTHTSVGATTVRRCAWCHHAHAHTQRTGRGSGHSGGGWWEWGTVVVAATPHTQPPPPRAHHPVCVCVSGRGVDSTSTASGWTKWPHTPQHPRCHHHIHHHHQQQQQEEEWCGVGHKEWVDW